MSDIMLNGLLLYCPHIVFLDLFEYSNVLRARIFIYHFCFQIKICLKRLHELSKVMVQANGPRCYSAGAFKFDSFSFGQKVTNKGRDCFESFRSLCSRMRSFQNDA